MPRDTGSNDYREGRAFPKLVLTLLLPVLAWALLQAWSTKLDRSEFLVHERAIAVHDTLINERLHEILCALKPARKGCD